MTTDQQLVAATERIASALEEWCKIQRERLDKDYPSRPAVREALVTHVKTTEEELELEQQGDDNEEWGQRERDFLAQTRNKSGSGT